MPKIIPAMRDDNPLSVTVKLSISLYALTIKIMSQDSYQIKQDACDGDLLRPRVSSNSFQFFD
jgi:hypothetical protein